MSNISYFIVFKFNDENWLLLTQGYVEGRHVASPLYFSSVKTAKAVFDTFTELFNERKTDDPYVLTQIAHFLEMYPVVMGVPNDGSTLSSHVEDSCLYHPGYPLVNKPHCIVKMRPSFSQFQVCDLVAEICSGIRITENGMVEWNAKRVFIS